MKNIKFGLFSVILLAGCGAFSQYNQYQNDVEDNQYNEQQIHADPAAAYVGEWTTATNVRIRSIKIKEDGRIKVCLSPSGGTEDGVVYMDNGTPVFMIETGAKARIIGMEKDSLLLEIYGKLEKFYGGQVPEECKSVFTNFK
jgi:hypothetical protein